MIILSFYIQEILLTFIPIQYKLSFATCLLSILRRHFISIVIDNCRNRYRKKEKKWIKMSDQMIKLIDLWINMTEKN